MCNVYVCVKAFWVHKYRRGAFFLLVHFFRIRKFPRINLHIKTLRVFKFTIVRRILIPPSNSIVHCFRYDFLLSCVGPIPFLLSVFLLKMLTTIASWQTANVAAVRLFSCMRIRARMYVYVWMGRTGSCVSTLAMGKKAPLTHAVSILKCMKAKRNCVCVCVRWWAWMRWRTMTRSQRKILIWTCQCSVP